MTSFIFCNNFSIHQQKYQCRSNALSIVVIVELTTPRISPEFIKCKQNYAKTAVNICVALQRLVEDFSEWQLLFSGRRTKTTSYKCKLMYFLCVQVNSVSSYRAQA